MFPDPDNVHYLVEDDGLYIGLFPRRNQVRWVKDPLEAAMFKPSHAEFWAMRFDASVVDFYDLCPERLP